MKLLAIFLTFGAAGFALAQAPSPTPYSDKTEYKTTRLYTPPDPNAKGGIHFVLDHPAEPLVAAFAIPQSDQMLVYRAEVNPNGSEATFTGLPIAKYDLILQFHSGFYEGITLNRDEDDLTPQDLQSIQAAVEKSNPFFEVKKIYRAKGATGKGTGTAMVVLEQLRRIKPGAVTLNFDGMDMKYFFRSVDLTFLEDVGPAWQILKNSEIARMDIPPTDPYHDIVPIRYSEDLGNIRVTDSVKDVGPVSLK